jgi:hypothetical protein
MSVHRVDRARLDQFLADLQRRRVAIRSCSLLTEDEFIVLTDDDDPIETR